MRGIRRNVQPKASVVQPAMDFNLSIAEQVKLLYPNGQLPNCPDGRYRPNVQPKQGGNAAIQRQREAVKSAKGSDET